MTQSKSSRKSSKSSARRGKSVVPGQGAAPPADAATPGAAAEDNALRILSGLHIGASRALAEKEMILIGAGADCDIVLSDPGVAPHHALIGLLGGTFSVRALDAPLRLDGRPLHPGDPVELAAMQRIELGQAALAVGAVDDPAWSSLLPVHGGSRPAPAPYMRRLPAVAAFAVLSLMSVAILAAVVPKRGSAPPPRDSLAQLIPEFGIADGRAKVDANGIPVLSGTVKDAATRDRIRQRLIEEGISASLDLRVGEDIAADVQDAFRSQGIATRTRYLGNGDVEVSGNFGDKRVLEEKVRSRIVTEVAGLRRIITRNYEPVDPSQPAAVTAAKDPPAEPKAEVALVAIVRGKEPHVLGSDGTRFNLGDRLPDGSTLTAIGSEFATALDAAGQMKRVQLAPPPQEGADATTVAVGVAARTAPPAPPRLEALPPATKTVPVAAAGSRLAAARPGATPSPPAPQPQAVARAKPRPEPRM
jgi:hypothetical protein